MVFHSTYTEHRYRVVAVQPIGRQLVDLADLVDLVDSVDSTGGCIKRFAHTIERKGCCAAVQTVAAEKLEKPEYPAEQTAVVAERIENLESAGHRGDGSGELQNMNHIACKHLASVGEQPEPDYNKGYV